MSNKSLFNFYLDDSKKEEAIAKLNRLCGDDTKGKLAAYIRLQIDIFLATPDDKVNPDMLDAINAEYEMCKLKNKRSRL